MERSDYRVIRYRAEYKTGVVRLLSHMWGRDQTRNLLHFGWKYEKNPFAREPECYVAMDQGQVVGFLGFFVNRWAVGKGETTLSIPVGSDLIVHPGYRDKGLMRALHEAAFRELPERYPIILVFSPNQDSTPRAISLGYSPLTRIKRLRRYHFSRLLKRQGHRASPSAASPGAPELGNFGPIEVREKPLPGPLNVSRSGLGPGDRKIALLKDEAFYSWRFESERRKYLFYYYWEDGSLAGYMVLRTTGHPPSGLILDFEYADGAIFDAMLKFVVGHANWITLTVWDLGLEGEVRSRFRKRGFIPTGWVPRVLQKSQANPCVLIRPPKNEFSESDFFFQGLDLRNTENWLFREICSDIS